MTTVSKYAAILVWAAWASVAWSTADGAAAGAADGGVVRVCRPSGRCSTCCNASWRSLPTVWRLEAGSSGRGRGN